MAFTTVDNPELYLQAKTYSGNGSTNAITFDGSENMQPDWLWLKTRSNAVGSNIFDVLRGTNSLHSDTAGAQADRASDGFTSLDSDGFTLNGSGSGGSINVSGRTYVGWGWKAGGSASSNSNGSITSSVSANTTAGFSVVSYTGTGANATVGHGLGVAPKMFIVKNRSTATNWHVYHHKNTSAPETDYLLLNTTNATADNSIVWNDTAPTSSVFSIGTTDGTNKNTSNMIAYCFADVKGYSKFGSYTGNGNADGTFVYTGFKPAFVLNKLTSGADDWQILDNKRSPHNIVGGYLRPNSSGVTVDNDVIDFTSNGFKLRTSAGSWNPSGGTFIYMAFAESPFVNSNGVPTNAR